MRRTKIAAYTVGILMSIGVVAGAYGLGGVVKQQQAKAVFPVEVLLDFARVLEFVEVEAQEITVDQIRKMVIEQATKKVIEKIIYGGGGVSDGSSAFSGNGEGSFIIDYSQYLYREPEKDVRAYVDVLYDKYLPSYIDSSIKKHARERYDPDYSPIPSDCVDIETIDPNASGAHGDLLKSLQFGCNDLSAAAFLYGASDGRFQELTNAAEAEAIANSGVLAKNEETNKLEQSGVVYEGIVQGALAAVYNVQTESESAISSIIGAFLDQVLDEILSQKVDG